MTPRTICFQCLCLAARREAYLDSPLARGHCAAIRMREVWRFSQAMGDMQGEVWRHGKSDVVYTMQEKPRFLEAGPGW